MQDQTSLKEKIEEALKSPKVDPYMMHQYHILMTKDPGIDLNTTKVHFLMRAKSGLDFKGKMGRIGGIYAIGMPYAELPDLIN